MSMITTFLKPKNRCYSKLAAAITSGATSLTVTSGDGGDFPDTYPYHLTIENEIVSVTNRVGDAMTIVRAREGTTAVAHANNTYVALNITAKAITDLHAAVHTIEQAMEVGFVYLKVIGPADYPIDLSEATINSGGADIKLSNAALIDNTVAGTLKLQTTASGYVSISEGQIIAKCDYLDLDLDIALRFIGTGKNIDGEVIFRDKLTVGRPAGGGVDFILYGAVTNYRVMWDANGDTRGRWTFGDNDYGVDVAFRGATSGVSMLWDASADTLTITQASMTQAFALTATTGGEEAFKMTITDAATQTSGMNRAFVVDLTVSGAKSSTAHSEGASIDLTLSGNTNTAYGMGIWVTDSGGANHSLTEGLNIYLENMGAGTLGAIIGLDIGINSTNVATGRHAALRMRNHSGIGKTGILFEGAFITGIDLGGTGGGGIAGLYTRGIDFTGSTCSVAEIDLDFGKIIFDQDGDTDIHSDVDDELDFKISGANFLIMVAGVFRPGTTNQVDLGSSAKQFKDIYVDGIAYIDTLGTSGHGTIIDTAVAKGTWTASGTWTIPAVTFGGAIDCGGQTLTNANAMEVTGTTAFYHTLTNSSANIFGGTAATTGALIELAGISHGTRPSQINMYTTDGAASYAARLTISGEIATAVVTWGNVYHVGLKYGLAGTATGAFTINGATSGVVTVTVNATAGTWTMTLPAAVGTAGHQLTDAAGNGITSWAAPASLREYKDIICEANPQDALDAILKTKAYHFHYKEGMGTLDMATEYVGVLADEAPWAMHYGGAVVNPVNTLGYMVLGFQAMEARIESVEDKIERLESELAELKASLS